MTTFVKSNRPESSVIPVEAIPRFTAADLDAMPTLSSGHTADLKIDGPGYRVWAHRTTRADGERFDRPVTIETYNGYQWTDFITYEGQDHRRSRA